MNKDLIQKFLNKACWDEQAQYELEDWLNVEKFAELIVQECMACSTWVGKVNMNAIEPVHTAQAINQRIKHHFGVEL
jgi:hypothetical protein